MLHSPGAVASGFRRARRARPASARSPTPASTAHMRRTLPAACAHRTCAMPAARRAQSRCPRAACAPAACCAPRGRAVFAAACGRPSVYAFHVPMPRAPPVWVLDPHLASRAAIPARRCEEGGAARRQDARRREEGLGNAAGVAVPGCEGVAVALEKPGHAHFASGPIRLIVEPPGPCPIRRYPRPPGARWRSAPARAAPLVRCPHARARCLAAERINNERPLMITHVVTPRSVA